MPVYENTQIISGEEITIAIEVDKLSAAPGPYQDLRDGSKSLTAVRDLFDDGMTLARNCAVRVVDGINNMGQAVRPDQFELQLAIKLDTEVGAIIAKSSTGAQLQVKMTWKRKEEE